METTRIKVAVRVRPFLETEIYRGYENSTLKVDKNKREVLYTYNDGSLTTKKAFQFDHVLDEQNSQEDIYNNCQITKLVNKALEGYHSTIFAYGQTGSGKTFTMQGREDPQSKALDGIIPKAIGELFDSISRHKEKTFVVSVSFLQIYNEKVFDLLNPISFKSGVGLKLRWNKNQQFSVENLFVYECKNTDELMRHFVFGLRNRVSSSHKLNMNSSRSHSILTIKIQSFEHSHPTRILSSKIELVDLAGSQRIGLTGAEGRLAKESIDINKSLFTLRQVISTLADWGRKNKETSQHIPYRDSKLTSILKQSIGGNSYCLMIACISPNDSFLDENISTLTYATKATMIINKPIVNDDPNMKKIEDLKGQVKALTEELGKANRHIELISQGVVEKPMEKSDLIQDGLQHSSRLRRGVSERVSSGDYEQFSDRLVESINTVRQLLRSNKDLREQLQQQKQNIEQKDVEIFNLQKENETLQQHGAPAHLDTIPNMFEQVPPPTHHPSRFGSKHLKSSQKYQSKDIKLISANITVHNFNSRPMEAYEAVNSAELNKLMNETAMDSMPTNFNKREVSTAKMNMSSRTNNTIERYRKTFTSKSKRHSMDAYSHIDGRRGSSFH